MRRLTRTFAAHNHVDESPDQHFDLPLVVAQWLAHLPLVLEGPGLIPACGDGKFRCPNTLSLVSFAGMTLDKCIVLGIGTLTGCPLLRENHPLCRLKNPTVI